MSKYSVPLHALQEAQKTPVEARLCKQVHTKLIDVTLAKKCNLLHSKNTSFAELIRVNSPHKSLQLVTVRPRKRHPQKNIQRHCINEHI